jgi:RNA polymerase sigma-70 factor (ECF subfamily)
LEAARKGSLEAFNRLVLEHQDAVYNFALRALCDETAAEELARRVFQTAFRELGRSAGRDLRLWLLRLAAKASLERLKDWRGRYRTPPAVQAWGVGSPVEACLRQIPPDLRLSLVLVDLEGLDYAQAAAVLGASPKKVQARLAQARQWVLRSQGAARPLSA